MIASSSAIQYKGSTKSPQVIASELSADYLLSGKVRWATGAEGEATGPGGAGADRRRPAA